MNSDYKELLKLFNDSAVKYLVVGGYAVMLYTEPRFTKDLGLWIEASAENAERVYRALAQFGAPLARLSIDDFAHEGFFYQIGRPPARVDILMPVDGLTFEEAWRNRQRSVLDGEPAWFIARGNLIKNKRALGRHIDLHDAENLESSDRDLPSS